MFMRVLLPTDFSASADAALAAAREHFPDAALCLLHVIDPKQVARSLTSSMQAAEARKELEHERMGHLKGLSREGEECTVAVGKAAEMILSQAELWKPDLILMGTHGRTGLDHFLNGSVAEAVVRHSRLPVLIVHENKLQDGQ